jgi:hypothetical protein
MRRTGIGDRCVSIALRSVRVNVYSLDNARIAAMAPGGIKTCRGLCARGFKSSRQP